MATAMSQPPAIPPRPIKSQDKGNNDAKAPPKIPARPTRHLERKISDDRFAPSPLNEGFPKNPKTTRFGPDDDVNNFSSEPHERPGSVALPSLGEEGSEYAAVTEELQEPEDPEQTRTVSRDMKLHAPKPSLPVQSAKQRVAAVTRIGSDKVASFNIGKSIGDDSSYASPKKRSTTSHLSSEDGREFDDEHGIPEIGQRVPMYPNAGDVQAPSPAPQSLSPEAWKGGRHHRRVSSQSGDHPPGSYGLHGHGHVSNDKLEKAYYDKHPEELRKELSRPYHDRQNDHAMSREELNQIIHDTASRGSGLGTSGFQGTPTEEIGFQAHEEYASRIASPRTTSAAAKSGLRQQASPEALDEDIIHVDEPQQSTTDGSATEEWERAPILAEDEVAIHPRRFKLHAAVEPSPEAPHEYEEGSRPASRHSSRPTSAHAGYPVPEFEFTPLEDVEEYEPLFNEEGKGAEPLESPSIDRASAPPRFPSKDIWEDAPSSAHQTAEVNTPEAGEAKPKRAGLPESSIPTPAQAFAKHQEELAEKEARRMGNFVPRGESKKSSWLPLQPVVVAAEETQERPAAQRRFPSRDVWEDAPESHLHQTTVSSDQIPESKPEQPDVPARPARSSERPAIPGRPKPKKTPSDEVKSKPAVLDKPKPQIPARPSKNIAVSPEAKEAPAPKPKPAIPARPAGGKIAALQAGFMSDLNRRLQLGPSAPKKEEPQSSASDEQEPEAPKKPLADARKGRARGPQRRAPARSPAPPVAAPAMSADTKPEIPSLSFSIPHVVWSISPEDSSLAVGEAEDATKPVATREAPPLESSEVDVPETLPSKDDILEPTKTSPVDGEEAEEVKQDAAEAVSPEGLSTGNTPAEFHVPQAEPLEEDVAGVEHLGDLPPVTQGRFDPVLSNDVKMVDTAKAEEKDA